MIFIGKISKGHNSVKNVYGIRVLFFFFFLELGFLFSAHRLMTSMELRFFFPAHPLMVVYICTKFHENILDGIKVIERT